MSRNRAQASGAASSSRGGIAVLAATLFCQATAMADVGLPRYQPPQAESQPERQGPVLQEISHGESSVHFQPLDCQRNGLFAATTLDLAPPADQRIGGWPSEPGAHSKRTAFPEDYSASRISVLMTGNSAMLRIGEMVNSVRVYTNNGATILTSRDGDYFSRLQAVRPVDTLLVENSRTIRRYRVKETRILPMGQENPGDSTGQSLMLAACYPFQPIGTSPLLYVVLAEPVPAPLTDASQANHSSQETQGGSYETVKF